MWTCVKCQSKVDDHFDICWNCGTTRAGVADPEFVSADQMPPIKDPRYDPIATPDPSIKAHWATVHGPPEDELVVCYRALNLVEAKFLSDQLLEQGIPAVNDIMDRPDVASVMDGWPKVYCRKADFDKAKAWLKEYETSRREQTP